ncbi:cholesterol 25-hydroxylase-like protein 1 member 2 [Biomphalaria pfeifferi]|uniref:Cholesterol 25-hydroxylase-like protein 1 member 2 n=1 Tax=Biomphalaria pfeifferi TaxID=112525 RepID=A0AAD8B5F9_BIOPF|nr:cholesterol 25-hydroxylase-like protein 1 member 2 [Biomphalaria pfeifferi]
MGIPALQNATGIFNVALSLPDYVTRFLTRSNTRSILQIVWDFRCGYEPYLESPVFPIILSVVFYFVTCLPFTLLDIVCPKQAWYRKYKIQVDKEVTTDHIFDALSLTFWNHILLVLPRAVAQWIWCPVMPLPEEAPSLFEFCWHQMAGLFLFDLQYFCWHVAHHKIRFLYKHIHAVHHHFSSPFAWVTQYLHPFELAAFGFLTTANTWIFNCHPLTAWRGEGGEVCVGKRIWEQSSGSSHLGAVIWEKVSGKGIWEKECGKRHLRIGIWKKISGRRHLGKRVWEKVSGKMYLGEGIWEKVSMRRYMGEGIWEKVSGRGYLGEGIWEKVSGKRCLGDGIWEKVSAKAYLGKSIWEKVSWRRHLGKGIWEKVSGRRYLGKSIWEKVSGRGYLGKGFWESVSGKKVSGKRYLGKCIWEKVSGKRYLGEGIWEKSIWEEASGKRYPGKGVWEMVSGKMYLGEGIWEKVSGKKHLGKGIWERVSGKRFLGKRIWEKASGKMYLGEGIWEKASGKSYMLVSIIVSVEAHIGFDFPFLLHNLDPTGIFGGPTKHDMHHLKPHTNYQPFFNHWDRLFGTYCPPMKSCGIRNKTLQDNKKHTRQSKKVN